MSNKVKVALYVPGKEQQGKYFPLQLKSGIYNEPAEYNQPAKLLAIANIEGNFRKLYKLLIRNGVMDRHYRWTFGDGHLVILGNCFDKGRSLIECLWLIYSLEEKAQRKGGYVHFILGNYEMMSFNEDWCYIHPKYAIGRGSSKSAATALYDGNSELWRWLRTKNIIEKIGDALFAHGGISGDINQLQLSIEDINRVARPYYTKAMEPFNDPVLKTIFNPGSSPFEYREYHLAADKDIVNASLAQFNITTIVTGHSLVDHITPFFDGEVINISAGHATGSSEALLIKGNAFYRANIKGEKERIK